MICEDQRSVKLVDNVGLSRQHGKRLSMIIIMLDSISYCVSSDCRRRAVSGSIDGESLLELKSPMG